MHALRPRLVQYKVGSVDEEVTGNEANGPRVVLVAHDEMTAQAHDGKRCSWVLKGEQPLRKKGVGHGLHQSDFICSTVGWLADASQQLEYGKNHNGMWNSDLFVKQLTEKFFLAFAAAHPPGYIAAVLVDNSQGHSSYAADALRANLVNMGIGGKQPAMRTGWYIRDNEKIIQPMVFPPDHSAHPGLQKGARIILQERGLWKKGLILKCTGRCDPDITDCCARQILHNQPDFQAQKSRVQEIIKSAGHICIMLPKYHCELNFIEYFWGAVKRWLREHCDYKFATLKENMLKALRSVPVELVRKWEHRMWRFIEAYTNGHDVTEAQKIVRAFSSCIYTSHRRTPEKVASAMDY